MYERQKKGEKSTRLVGSVGAVAEIVVEPVSGESLGPILAFDHLRAKILLICTIHLNKKSTP